MIREGMSDERFFYRSNGTKIGDFTVQALARREAKRVLAQTDRTLAIEEKRFFLPVQNHPLAGYS